MSAAAGWTTPADIVAKVRRRWDDGTLLRAYAAGEPCPALNVPLRGPGPRDIGERLGEVRAWVEAVERGSRDQRSYALEYAGVGGRLVGRNQVPARAKVTSFAQAWSLLGVAADVRQFDAVLEVSRSSPTILTWVRAHPLKALTQHDVWPQVVAAYAWLEAQRGSGARVRQIDAPGVDTKFVERHRPVLAALLDVPGSAAGFAAGLGLATTLETVRLRFAPGFAGLPGHLTEATFRLDQLSSLDARVRRALVIENEATFLSVDVPPEGVVVWGKGFEVDRVGSLPWLREADIDYWGDIDTHGFAILDRLRAWLPQTRSVLMDRETLLAHQERWGVEDRPTRARLDRLDATERAVYDDLVSDRLGDRVRLEQERIAWGWVSERLASQR